MPCLGGRKDLLISWPQLCWGTWLSPKGRDKSYSNPEHGRPNLITFSDKSLLMSHPSSIPCPLPGSFPVPMISKLLSHKTRTIPWHSSLSNDLGRTWPWNMEQHQRLCRLQSQAEAAQSWEGGGKKQKQKQRTKNNCPRGRGWREKHYSWHQEFCCSSRESKEEGRNCVCLGHQASL